MLDLVLPHIPFTESFVEVFAGGMSVGLAVAARGTRVWAYDIDRSLACFWHYQSTDPQGLRQTVEELMPDAVERYDDLRDSLETGPFGIDLAAAAFVISRLSFAAMGAASSAAPHRSRLNHAALRLLDQTDMAGVTVQQADFHDVIPRHRHDFLYLDPPYLMEGGPANNRLYGRNGCDHQNFDHDGLFDLLKDRGAWLLSYGEHPTIREMYRDFPVVEHLLRSSAHGSRERVELLIFPRSHGA